jgi:hypothetical protein
MPIIYDSKLELQPWSLNIPSNGSDIGGCDPASYSLDQSFDEVALELQGTTQQGGYPTIEGYIKRSIPANTGNVSLSFDLLPSVNLLNEYLYETDLIIAWSGYKYNLSLQLVAVANGYSLQVADLNGDWAVTGIIVPAFLPVQSVHYLIIHQFNITTKKRSTIAAVINNQLFLIPSQFQNIAATSTNWEDVAIVQQQRTLTPAAGNAGKSASDRLVNIELAWW